MPWTTLLQLNEPFYPKSAGPGQPAKPLFCPSSPSIARQYGVT